MHRKLIIPAVVLLSLLSLACWSHKDQFHTVVTNGTSGPLHSIEVDYPGGTYGIADLPAGASNHKWVFANGPCQYSIHFVDANGKSYSPKPIDISKGSCPEGVTLSIDASMKVSAAATTK